MWKVYGTLHITLHITKINDPKKQTNTSRVEINNSLGNILLNIFKFYYFEIYYKGREKFAIFDVF